MKLQQAFVSETGESYGNFKIIGYSAPGTNSATTNFTYSDQGQYTNNTATLNTSAKETWRATANLKLNDCNSGSYWKISVAKASNGSAADAVVFTADISGTGCEELTPSYKKIGK